MSNALVFILVLVVMLMAPAAPLVASESFPCVAHDAHHSGIADGGGPVALGEPRFVATVPGMELIGPSTPVVAASMVTVLAEYYDEAQGTYTDSYVLAFSELDGALLWSASVGERAYSSWSSPTVFSGEVRGESIHSVYVAWGDTLRRLDAATGVEDWRVPLDRPVANASPIVAADTVFVTDYTGAAPGGKLYAYDALDGALVWSRAIGQTNGNTPAYFAGAVYVTTADGGIFCFDAADGTRRWHRTLFSTWDEAFFGGLSVRDGALYAATYGFYGGEDNSTLLKMNATDGAVLWTTRSERTDTMPVVAAGKVFLAGGVSGYGSARKLECFDESSGALLWSYRGAGGWLQQPCYAGGLLYAGLISSTGYYYGPAGNLHILDPAKAPGDPGFILDMYADAGSSPSVANGNVYSIGMLGNDTALYAFGPLPVAAPHIVSITRDPVTLTWTALHGLAYVVQYCDATPSGAYDPAGNWTDIVESQVTESDGVPGDEGLESWTDDGTSSAGTSTTGGRFYRVRVVTGE